MKKWLGLAFLFASLPLWASDPLSLALPEPQLCLYSRIGPTLREVIREQIASTTAGAAVSTITSAYVAGRDWGNTWKQEIQKKAGKNQKKKSLKPDTSSPSRMVSALAFLRDRMKFVPEETWLYVRNSSEFLLVVSGDVVPENWRCLFSPELLINRGKGFSVGNQLQNSRENPILLHVTPGFLLVFPANLEGTVLDGLSETAPRLGEKWNTFMKMANLKPLLALELDTSEQVSAQSEAGAPFPFSEIQRLRCLVSTDLIKGQAFLIHDDARTLVLSQIIDLVRELTAPLETATGNINQASLQESPWPAIARAMKAKIQGQSVFLDGPGFKHHLSTAGAAVIGAIDSLISRHLPADLLPTSPKQGLLSAVPCP